MNNVKLIVLTLWLVSCNSQKSNFFIEQLNSTQPIIILENDDHEIVKLNIPLLFEIKNKSKIKKISFSSISYKDFVSKSMSASLLYSFINDSLQQITKSKYKFIDSKETKKYILYTQHYLDSLEKKELGYLKEKSINLKIKISDVITFKTKHKQLLKRLTKGDSIYIRVEENSEIKTIKYPIKI
ncbi:hypothetical protein [Aquimarina agarivorans]|uniref:hypothetical protein n=1 Tax=Aquimarina agarivorans TaxID=980584 RepID=UPI000248EA06|nr:hypothetical protein [Aquimarina agarivorans]